MSGACGIRGNVKNMLYYGAAFLTNEVTKNVLLKTAIDLATQVAYIEPGTSWQVGSYTKYKSEFILKLKYT